jgi:hypothetical protein
MYSMTMQMDLATAVRLRMVGGGKRKEREGRKEWLLTCAELDVVVQGARGAAVAGVVRVVVAGTGAVSIPRHQTGVEGSNHVSELCAHAWQYSKVNKSSHNCEDGRGSCKKFDKNCLSSFSPEKRAATQGRLTPTCSLEQIPYRMTCQTVYG